ncbi:MAG TPA: Fic family protein [Candidatus Paceibacterota bacterium]
MLQKPPDWQKVLQEKSSKIFSKLYSSSEVEAIFSRAQEKYVYWDTFRHYTFPKGVKADEAWAFLKLTQRVRQERTPAKSIDGKHFGFSYTKALYRRLNIIDTNAAGLIQTLAAKPTANQKEQLIISGLSEEAIASSQIEGANTSRKVAKEMIYSGRKPRNRSEQMIVNNYQAMQLLDNLKDLDLTEEILLEIQDRITKGTLEDSNDAGRFRTDADDIVVTNRLTGEIAFVPPDEKLMRAELARFLDFANNDGEDEQNFLHPVIKAIVLHFWLAYMHPFVDGNGRTARAIFYWYLMRKGYWLFQYLSVSRIIKLSKKKYDDAFLYTELDENDLTYFLLYITDVTCRAIGDMMEHYERKVKEAEQYKKVARIYSDLNERQVALMVYLDTHPDETVDVTTHKNRSAVVYETARRDLMGLTTKGLLAEIKKGNKNVYVPNINAIRKLLKK